MITLDTETAQRLIIALYPTEQLHQLHVFNDEWRVDQAGPSISGPELTFRNATETHIEKAFDRVILQLISPSRVRNAELQHGKQGTDCVSICVSKASTYLTLTIGAIEGATIREGLKES